MRSFKAWFAFVGVCTLGTTGLFAQDPSTSSYPGSPSRSVAKARQIFVLPAPDLGLAADRGDSPIVAYAEYDAVSEKWSIQGPIPPKALASALEGFSGGRSIDSP